jgi:hypothetical protein
MLLGALFHSATIASHDANWVEQYQGKRHPMGGVL